MPFSRSDNRCDIEKEGERKRKQRKWKTNDSEGEISIGACLWKLMVPKIDVLGHSRIYICFFAQLNTHWFMPSPNLPISFSSLHYAHTHTHACYRSFSFLLNAPTQLRTFILFFCVANNFWHFLLSVALMLKVFSLFLLHMLLSYSASLFLLSHCVFVYIWYILDGCWACVFICAWKGTKKAIIRPFSFTDLWGLLMSFTFPSSCSFPPFLLSHCVCIFSFLLTYLAMSFDRKCLYWRRR